MNGVYDLGYIYFIFGYLDPQGPSKTVNLEGPGIVPSWSSVPNFIPYVVFSYYSWTFWEPKCTSTPAFASHPAQTFAAHPTALSEH